MTADAIGRAPVEGHVTLCRDCDAIVRRYIRAVDAEDFPAAYEALDAYDRHRDTALQHRAGNRFEDDD